MAGKNESGSGAIRILAVDDDPSALEIAELAVQRCGGARLSRAPTAAEALRLLSASAFDLVLLDLGLGDNSGSALLSEVIGAARGALVVVITADERPATIVECMKRGAFDYAVKPIQPQRLATAIEHARSIIGLRRELRELGGEGGDGGRDPAFSRIITRSPLMLGLFRSVERVARSPLAVVVAGESGVGKELVSRAIHDLSRREGAFVPVNAAGLDDELFADTLFGHVRGAYTGAEGRRRGLVHEADGGTLFLDEIGDIGGEAQVKLLRFLQDGEFYPLGSDRPERSSARLVLATNADLLDKVRKGEFRDDLYYRLMIHYIAVPPLRERTEDIPLLIEKFSADAAASQGRRPPESVDAFLAAIEGYSFPGNVRELFALVNGAMSWSEGGVLSASYAIDYLRSRRAGGQAESPLPACEPGEGEGPFLTLEELTDRHIEEALHRSGGNQSAAAKLLGISQSTISRRKTAQP